MAYHWTLKGPDILLYCSAHLCVVRCVIYLLLLSWKYNKHLRVRVKYAINAKVPLKLLTKRERFRYAAKVSAMPRYSMRSSKLGGVKGGVVIWGVQICSPKNVFHIFIIASKNLVLEGSRLVFIKMWRAVNHGDTIFLQLVESNCWTYDIIYNTMISSFHQIFWLLPTLFKCVYLEYPVTNLNKITLGHNTVFRRFYNLA